MTLLLRLTILVHYTIHHTVVYNRLNIRTNISTRVADYVSVIQLQMLSALVYEFSILVDRFKHVYKMSDNFKFSLSSVHSFLQLLSYSYCFATSKQIHNVFPPRCAFLDCSHP